MNQPTDFDRRYLELVLEIDKHIDGYIDAYIGPDNLQDKAAGRAARPAQQLKEDVNYLAETIPTADPARHAYLKALLRAVDTTIQIKMNEFKRYFDMLKRAEDNWKREQEFFHKQLGEIYGSLKSVDERVRRMYPDYNAKFDELNKLAEKKEAHE